MSAAGAIAAAAAAASQRSEEERMTPYSPNDLTENWEFKILRSTTNRFRDPLWLHEKLQEEARAGWTLLEKFDDSRVRLKRPARARANDAALGFDPYRIWVGTSQAKLAAWIILGSIVGSAMIVLIVFVIIFFVTNSGR